MWLRVCAHVCTLPVNVIVGVRRHKHRERASDSARRGSGVQGRAESGGLGGGKETGRERAREREKTREQEKEKEKEREMGTTIEMLWFCLRHKDKGLGFRV